MKNKIFIKFGLLAVLFLMPEISFSSDQKRTIDSLKVIIQQTNNDTIRINALREWDDLIYVSDPKLDWELNLKIQKISEKKLRSKLSKKEMLFYKKSLSKAYNVIGLILVDEGNYDQALEIYDKALKIDHSIDDQSGVAASYTNIGIIYRDLEESEKAIDYFNKALEIYEKLNDETSKGIAYANLGVVYYKMKDYKTTLSYYEKSLTIRLKNNDEQGMAYSYSNIGAVYSDMNDQKKALEYYELGLKLRRTIDDRQGIAGSLVNIGNIYFEQKKYDLSMTYLIESYQYAKEVDAVLTIRDVCLSLYKLYKLKGRFNEALAMFEEYEKNDKRLSSEENQKAVYKQQFKNEYENKSFADSVKHAQKQKLSQAKLEKKNAELQVKQNLQIFLIVGFLLILIFAIFIFNRFRVTNKQKLIIEQKEAETSRQRNIIEEKQKEILDSINYAKRIQYTLLAHDELLRKNLKEYFIFFKPKDIVSGDFYWATKKDNDFYLAVCDSTGHGVPGAFMSLLNISFLNEAINEKNISEPNKVLNHVRNRLIENMEGGQDGMDATLIRLCGNKLEYASANNQPVLISNNKLVELNSDKMPVGKGENLLSFTLFEQNLQPGDIVYFFTDGFADQFGGDKGKKFKYSQLQKLLLEISNKEMSVQSQILNEKFNNWKGELEQIDDVCIIGIKF